MLWSELSQLDAGKWWEKSIYPSIKNDGISIPNSYSDVTIPLFIDTIQYCKSNNIFMNIEIKPTTGFDIETSIEIAKVIKDTFSDELNILKSSSNGFDYKMLPLFSSFSFDSLNKMKELIPEIPRGYLVEEIPTNYLVQLQELQASYIHCDGNQLSKSQVEDIKSNGYGIMCYTINDVEKALELFSWGVDAICTDRPDLMKDLK